MAAEKNRPRIVVAVGDPRGGNGLAALQVAADRDVARVCRVLLAGDFGALTAAARQAGIRVQLRRIALDEPGEDVPGSVEVIDRLKHPLLPRAAGKAGRAGERIVEDLDAALQMLLYRWADGVVVAPVDMDAVRAAGFSYTHLASLLAEWLRLDSAVALSPVPGCTYLSVAEPIPGALLLIGVEERPRERGLRGVMKEAVEVAAALVGAKA
ncbi:MAG: 4-hydroxythreonine-4-phosphate dehydrogenase PdxA [candidate division KSB1 bacterium]|nr:4-hydroxythreonine-4-phosphate dehydrogenase PdxA [candidate division KSB1 bacterium]